LPIPNAKAKTLMSILESRVVPDSVVYTGSFAGYDVVDDVVDVSRFYHVRINHEKAFVGGLGNRSHINGTLKLLEPGEATFTQKRHSAQALLLLHLGNANGASEEGTLRCFTVSC